MNRSNAFSELLELSTNDQRFSSQSSSKEDKDWCKLHNKLVFSLVRQPSEYLRLFVDPDQLFVMWGSVKCDVINWMHPNRSPEKNYRHSETLGGGVGPISCIFQDFFIISMAVQNSSNVAIKIAEPKLQWCMLFPSQKHCGLANAFNLCILWSVSDGIDLLNFPIPFKDNV